MPVTRDVPRDPAAQALVTGGEVDLAALLAYLSAAPRLGPPPSDRITVLP